MADEQELAPDTGAPEVLDAPIEDIEIQEEAPRTKTVEDFARERGWKPKDEFTDPEKEWRDAESFLAFGMDRNRDIITDVKHLRETTERMARTQAQITQQAVDRARAEERQRYEAQLTEAVETGDRTAAFEATQKIAELAQPAPVQPGPDPLVDEFVRDNSWFNSDPLAKAVAVQVCDRLHNRPVEEQLKAARDEVLKRFPEYAPTPSKAPPAVHSGSRVADTRKSGKKGFADLSSEEQMVAREMVKRKLIPNVEAYVENAFGQGAV